MQRPAQVAEPGSPLLARALAVAEALRNRLGAIAGLHLLEASDSRQQGQPAAARPGQAAKDPTRLTVGVWGLGISGARARAHLIALRGAVRTSSRGRLGPSSWWVRVCAGYEAADALRELGVSVELSTPRSVVLCVTGGLSLRVRQRQRHAWLGSHAVPPPWRTAAADKGSAISSRTPREQRAASKPSLPRRAAGQGLERR